MLMKKLLLLFVGMWSIFQFASAQVYPINFDVNAVSTHYGSYGTATRPSSDARWTYSVSLETGDTIAIATRGAGNIYYDKTSEQLTAWVGAGTIQPVLHFHGVWMYRYVYIDWNNDGQFGDGTDPGDELVSWSGVASNGDLQPLPAITIPEGTTPGTYYIRFKVEWDETNPGGKPEGEIIPHGGLVCDTRLVLTAEKPSEPINVTPESGAYTNEDVNSFYDAVFKGQSTYSNSTARYISNFSLNGTSITPHTSGSARLMYTSYLNSNTQFHVLIGQSYTPARTMEGEWMHHYLYIDYDHNGQFANGASTATDDKELVSYNYFEGTNKLGATTNSQGNNVPLPAFTVADDVAPGVYAMRLKQDWDWLDPTAATQKGSNNFQGNGGEILDFRLVIHNNECWVESLCDIVDEDGASIENGGSSVKLFRPTRSVKSGGATIDYSGTDISNGNTIVSYGTATSLSVTPESEDYLLSEVKVKYGFNVDDDQYVAGLKQWDEVDLTSQLGETGGTVNLPSSITSADTVRFLVKTIENPVTAINKVDVEKQSSNIIYDLQGRRVQKTEKGIYIINGQKVIF